MGSTCPTPTSIRVDLKRLQGSRGHGFEPLQEVLKARESGREARPGARSRQCSGEAAGGGGVVGAHSVCALEG